MIRAAGLNVKVCMMVHAVSVSQPSPIPRRPRVALHPVRLMQPADSHDELLRRVAEAQDRAAFQHLFEHFAPRIKAYLMRGGANAQTAEDLAQEAMLTLWRKARLFDPAKASAATWLFTIARNLRIDALRREFRPGFDPDDPSLLPQGERGADAVLEARAAESALSHAMHSLPSDQNEIVVQSFFLDKPHSQIAAELGIPLGTVKSRLRLAMARLRLALGDEV
jgi:RNA polymerase sigma factor (sigma-70 family)